MRPMAAYRRLGAVALAAALLAGPALAGSALAEDAASPPRPRIYRWIDENGVTHYTTELSRVPSPLRDKLTEPEPMQPEQVTPRAPAPAPVPTPWVERNVGPKPRPPAAASASPGPASSPGSVDTGNTGGGSMASGASGAREAPKDARLGDLEVQIAELSADIAADEETMKTMVSDPKAGDPEGPNAKQMREIGLRLPGMLAKLRELRKERAALEGKP